MKKRITLLLFVLLLIPYLMGAAIITESTPLTTAENFIMNEINSFISSGNAVVTWDETTDIDSYLELYDFDENIIGYIFRLKTNNVLSGFMQIGITDLGYHIVNLGFDGEDYLTKIMTHNNIPATSFKNTTKIYYTGGFRYYAYNLSDELISIQNNEIIEDSTYLQLEYETYIDTVNATIENKVSELKVQTYSTNDTSSYVDGWNTAGTYMRTMEYYESINSSYSMHCVPTASTNLVMYWKYGRGYFFNMVGAQEDVFEWFYENMESSSAGTSWSNIEPSISYFFNNASGGTVSTVKDSTDTFDEIKTKINQNIPMQLEVRAFATDANGNYGNHSINVWGYNVLSTGDFLYVTDNWGTGSGTSANYVSFSLLNYADYNYGQFVSVNVS